MAALILLIAGAFHFYRGVPSEGCVFCAVGLLVAADSAGLLPRPRPTTFLLPNAPLALGLAVPAAAGLTWLPPHGALDAVILGILGVVALGIGWWQPDVAITTLTPPHRRTAWLWTVLALALCVWELGVDLIAAEQGDEFGYPTLSALLEPAILIPDVRWGLLTGWLILGFALLRWSQHSTSADRATP